MYAVQQKLIGALAGTATPAQQLALQMLGLKKATDDHTLSADQAAKAQGLLVESFNVTQLQANVSAMGALASPTQQYAAAVAQLTLQANEGKMGQFALAAGVLAAKQAMDASVESIKEQYGIASQADIASAAYTKLNDDMAKIGATSAQSALTVAVVNKQIQNTADAMKVAGSSTPQFTQLILDLQNANKTKDELLTSSGNALLQAAPAFVQALQQGDTIAQSIAASLTGAAASIANAFAGDTTNEDDDECFESRDIRRQGRGDRGHSNLRLGRQNPTVLLKDRSVHANSSRDRDMRELCAGRGSQKRAA